MGVFARAMRSSPLILPAPNARASDPAPVVAHATRTRGRPSPSVAAWQLPLEEAHPEREVDEVVAVEVRRRAPRWSPSRAAARSPRTNARATSCPTVCAPARLSPGAASYARSSARCAGCAAPKRSSTRDRTRSTRARSSGSETLRALDELLQRVGERRPRGAGVPLLARRVARSRGGSRRAAPTSLAASAAASASRSSSSACCVRLS